MSKKPLPSPDSPLIGERIRWVRMIHANIKTVEPFAESLGVSRPSVMGWEDNKGIGFENLQKIALEYGVSLEWLGTGRGSPLPNMNGGGSDYEPTAIAKMLLETKRNTMLLWDAFGRALRAKPEVQAGILTAIDEFFAATQSPEQSESSSDHGSRERSTDRRG